MDGHRFAVSVHLHGTLAANAQGSFVLPCGATLEAVSACGSNANGATLQIGAGDDADGILTASAIGDSGAPAQWTRGAFDGALVASGQYPHLARGATVSWLLDFDGAGGVAAADVAIVFFFQEG
jgi:hypothetical protein